MSLREQYYQKNANLSNNGAIHFRELSDYLDPSPNTIITLFLFQNSNILYNEIIHRHSNI